jgi:hypothetical protein
LPCSLASFLMGLTKPLHHDPPKIRENNEQRCKIKWKAFERRKQYLRALEGELEFHLWSVPSKQKRFGFGFGFPRFLDFRGMSNRWLSADQAYMLISS